MVGVTGDLERSRLRTVLEFLSEREHVHFGDSFFSKDFTVV